MKSYYTKILVVGNGHLGNYLRKQWDCMLWKDAMHSLTKKDLELLNPSAVVIAAGKTNLQWCEEFPDDAHQNNVTDPCNMCEVVRSYNKYLPIFHLSTGCAWQGPYNNGRAFRPYDPPEPVCVYTETKVKCDGLLRENFEHVLILRPRLLYSAANSPRNTLQKINSYPKLINTPNSITCVKTVRKTIEQILTLPGFWADFPNKIMNVYDRGVVTPYQIGCYQCLLGRRVHPIKITKDELDAHHKPKRADVVLFDPVFEKIVNPDYAWVNLEACITNQQYKLEYDRNELNNNDHTFFEQ